MMLAGMKTSTWRNVSDKDRILLWGRAAARCNHPSCKRFLVEPSSEWDAEAMFGQAAHIVAHSDEGPRGDPSYPRDKLDTYENLLLLCGNCHTIVDKQPNTYTVEDLRAWKEEHESWVRQVTEPDVHVPVPWVALVIEDEPKIDVELLPDAIHPDCLSGDPNRLMVDPIKVGWESSAAAQRAFIQDRMESVGPAERRFAVFALTRIPLAVDLGFALGDRTRATLYQFHRDDLSWAWPPSTSPHRSLGCSETILSDVPHGDVVLRVSLSATVSSELAHQFVPNPLMDFHIHVPDPSVSWLVSQDQLSDLAKTFRRVLERSRETLGERCDAIHLFYAGPVPGAITIGRQYNPRMSPPLYLYEYDQQASARYERVLCLGGPEE